jgi:Tol biopolymer transport system component
MSIKKLNSMQYRKMLRNFASQLLNFSTSQLRILLTLTLTLTLMGVIASDSEATSNYAFPWSSPVAIDSGSSNAYRTDIAFDRNGNAIAVFEQKDGDVYRIFANRYVNGKGWEGAAAIDNNSGNSYRAQIAFDKKGNALVVFKQEVGNGRYRIFANRYINNEGWQEAIPIDNGGGNVDGQDIVFDGEGNAAVVFEEYDGKEFGIYVSFYGGVSGWQKPFRIDSGSGNAYFPYPVFDDKGNLYVIYYREESLGLEAYVSRFERNEISSPEPALSNETRLLRYARNDRSEGVLNEKQNNGVIARSKATKQSAIDTYRLTDGNMPMKKEKWLEAKSEVSRGIKAVYNPIFLNEVKKRIYSGNYSYSRWETPSKLDSRFRDAYRPTLLSNGNGELTALFVRWDGENLSAYASSYKNGSWDRPMEIDGGKGDVEHLRGAINNKGEMAIVWTQWVDGSLRIHARVNPKSEIQNQKYGWGEAKIIDAGKKDGYNPSIAFTENGEIIAVWCQWEMFNVKSYINIYKKSPVTSHQSPVMVGEWGRAERLENKEGETCGVRIASGPGGSVIAAFEQETAEHQRTSHQSPAKPINRIFAISFTDTNTDTYTIKRLTDGNGEDYYAEFSPDGEKIVFVKKHGSSSNLYIMDTDGKNIRQLTSGNAADASPVWTSDGERIIFASNRVKEGWDIWSVKPDGSELTRLTKWSRNEYSPRPTSDGKNILYISTAGGDHSVWIMDMNGGNERRLTSGGTGDWFPSMNPDGRDVVFVSTRLGNGDIWTIDSAEKRYHRLTYTDLPEFSPSWSPDGSKVAYVTNKGGEFDIWIMDRDGKNKRRITKGLSDKKWGDRFSAIKIMETAGYYHLSWHLDGTKLLFTEFQGAKGNTYISMLEFDKGLLNQIEVDSTPVPEWTLIGEKELTAGDWEDFGPSFSPDGSSVAFSSNRSGNWDIWRMGSDGKGLQQITNKPSDEIAPVFSPDGKEIAFLKEETPNSELRTPNYNVWVMKNDGSGERQITKGISVISYPAWHPDGKRIAFVVRGEDGGTNIWGYDLVNSKMERIIVDMRGMVKGRGEQLPYSPLTKGDGVLSFYRIGYNPAGDKITFESNDSGNTEIWTMRTDGTNLARITNGDSPHWNPIWSPDGKMIAYATEKLGEEAGHHNWRNYNIWVANTETREERIITGEEQTDWNPVWSPDGKKIAYVTNRADGFKHFGIWMLYLK